MTLRLLSTSDLAQFTGSKNWYRLLYTDGAQHVAEHGGAYCLRDEIAVIQPYSKRVAAEEFQVWKLAVQLDEITLHFANNVIHLPSEYRAALRPRWRPRWRGFFLTVPENPVLFWSLTLAGRLSQPPHPLLKFRLTHGPVRSAVNQLPRASDTDES